MGGQFPRNLNSPGSPLGSIFLLFPMKVAGAHAHSSQGKSPPPRLLGKALKSVCLGEN